MISHFKVIGLLIGLFLLFDPYVQMHRTYSWLSAQLSLPNVLPKEPHWVAVIEPNLATCKANALTSVNNLFFFYQI